MGFFHTPVKLILSERSLFVVSAFARRLSVLRSSLEELEMLLPKTATPVALHVNYNVNDVNKTNQDYPTAMVPAW